MIGGPSTGSSGGSGSPLSGITSGETSPPGIPGASKTTTLLDANGGNGSNLLGNLQFHVKNLVPTANFAISRKISIVVFYFLGI